MSEPLAPTWRDSVSERLGGIEQGLKDLGRNFDTLVKELKGNGKPGALERLSARIKALEDAETRRAWIAMALAIVRAVVSVIAAAIILGMIRHYLHWI